MTRECSVFIQFTHAILNVAYKTADVNMRQSCYESIKTNNTDTWNTRPLNERVDNKRELFSLGFCFVFVVCWVLGQHLCSWCCDNILLR